MSFEVIRFFCGFGFLFFLDFFGNYMMKENNRVVSRNEQEKNQYQKIKIMRAVIPVISGFDQMT